MTVPIFPKTAAALLLTLLVGEPDAELDVRKFGARGDGQRDDTAAIQSAIDTAGRQGGGRVLLPAGTYLVSRTLRVASSGVELHGAGATLRLARGASDGKTVHVLEIAGSPGAPVVGVVVRRLTLDANYWQQRGALRPRGVQVRHARSVLLDRLHVRRAWVGITFGAGAIDCEVRDSLVSEWHNDGFSASGGGSSGGCRGIRFLRCRAVGSPDGAAGGLPGFRDNAWEIEDGARDVRLLECVVDRAGGSGFAVRSPAGAGCVTSDVEFVRCQVWEIGRRGWTVWGRDEKVRTARVRLVDCISQGPVSVARGAEDVRLQGCRLDAPLHVGFSGERDIRRARAAGERRDRSLAARSVSVVGCEVRKLVIEAREGAAGGETWVPRVALDGLRSPEPPEIVGPPDRVEIRHLKTEELGPLPARLRWNYHSPPGWAPERDRFQHRLPLLSPLVLESGETVRTADGWRARRRPELLRAWTRILGKLEPSSDDRPWFGDVSKAVVRSREERPGYRRLHLGIPLERDFLQEHLLLLPRDQGPGPFPAVIAWTSTSPDFRQPEEWWGAWLARRGYVVLTGWSFIRHYRGDTSYRRRANEKVYERFGRWLPMAKMVHDVRREALYLRSRPEVDGERLGFIGFSLSAKAALYVGAFAPEIRATVAIDPHVALQGNTNYQDPWYLDFRRQFADIETPGYPDPELRGTVRSLVDADPSRPGLERNHHELLALCAPRSFLLVGCSMDREGGAAHSDDLQSWPYVNRAREVYALLGIPERLELAAVSTGHRATSPEIDRAWQGFFERWLKETRRLKER